ELLSGNYRSKRLPDAFVDSLLGTAREVFPPAARPAGFIGRVMGRCGANSDFHLYASAPSSGLIFHIPPDLVVDSWVSDSESGLHRHFLFRPDVLMMFVCHISEEITSKISRTWYLPLNSVESGKFHLRSALTSLWRKGERGGRACSEKDR